MHGKKFLRKFLIASLAAGSLIFTPEIYGFPTSAAIVHAEVKEYVGVGESIVSDRETLEIGKQGARLQAIRNAQKEAGVFIGNYSVVKNHELDTDEVVALTAGVVKVNDNIKYEPIQVEQWVKYRATVVVTIDTDDLTAKVNQWLGHSSQDRSTLTEQTKALNSTLDVIQTRTAEIETAVLGASAKVNNAEVTEELKQIDRDILYAQKISEGNALLRKGDRNGAMKLYQEAIALYPKDATLAYEKLGDSYLEAKDYSHAVDAYTKVIQMDPKYSVPYFKRGKIYFDRKDYRKAAADFEKAIEIAPSSGQVHELLSWTYLLLGNYEAAIEEHFKAHRGVVNKEVFIDKVRAFESWDKHMKNGTATAYHYYGRGYYYYAGFSGWHFPGLFTQLALEDFTKAIELAELNPNDNTDKNTSRATLRLDKCFYRRARAYLAMNEYGKALDDFKKAVELAPNDCEYIFERAKIYLAMGEYGKALDDFKKGDQVVSEELAHSDLSDSKKKKRLDEWLKNPYRCYYFGRCYEELGFPKQAIENYKTAQKAFDSGKNVYWPDYLGDSKPGLPRFEFPRDMPRAVNSDIYSRLRELEKSK